MLRLVLILTGFVWLHTKSQAQSPVQNPFDYYRLLDKKLSDYGRLQDGETYLFTKHLVELYEAPTTETPSLLIPGNKSVRLLQVDEKNSEWAEVCFAGYSGWVQRNQLDSTAPKNYVEQYVPLQPFEAKTDYKGYILRSFPDEDAPDIGSRDYLLSFTVLSPQTLNGYYLVNQTLGKTGWVKKEDVRITGETPVIDFNSEQFWNDFEDIGLKDTSFSNFNVSVTVEYGISDTIRIYNGHRRFVLPPCNKIGEKCSYTIEALPYNQYFFVMVDGMYSYFYRTVFMPGSRYKYVYQVESKE